MNSNNTQAIEELLKPRYLAIAPYPFSDIEVGTILTERPMTNGDTFFNNLSKYPHLFRRLEWWEERQPEEMPDYVKCISVPDQQIKEGQVFIITEWTHHWGRAGHYYIFVYTKCFVPATEAEYTEYLNQQK